MRRAVPSAEARPALIGRYGEQDVDEIYAAIGEAIDFSNRSLEPSVPLMDVDILVVSEGDLRAGNVPRGRATLRDWKDIELVIGKYSAEETIDHIPYSVVHEEVHRKHYQYLTKVRNEGQALDIFAWTVIEGLALYGEDFHIGEAEQRGDAWFVREEFLREALASRTEADHSDPGTYYGIYPTGQWLISEFAIESRLDFTSMLATDFEEYREFAKGLIE